MGELKTVRTNVPRIEEGKNSANGEDVVELTKSRHVDGCASSDLHSDHCAEFFDLRRRRSICLHIHPTRKICPRRTRSSSTTPHNETCTNHHSNLFHVRCSKEAKATARPSKANRDPWPLGVANVRSFTGFRLGS